jgi:Zn finger protein HypA/HybF involved in hydrogenase expression
MSASQALMISAVVGAVGTVSSIRSQQAALARENFRLQQEAEMAKLAAIEEENARTRQLQETIANNKAFASIAGYYDDSRSFLNISKQAEKEAAKDIETIRLMGQSVQTKYSQMAFENKLKGQQLTFGGYTSVIAGLTTGYGTAKYYKT